MLKKILFSIFFFSCIAVFAQDPHFSQYNSSRINTNPAMVGSDSTLDITLGARLQWPKIDGGYTSGNFAADNYFRCLRGGLGINYLYDNQMSGTIKTARLGISYAPHFEFFKHKLAVQAGIDVSYFQKQIDWSKLTFGDMIDERRGFVFNTNEVTAQSAKAGVDISAGIFIYSKHFYGGVVMHHINQPDEGFFGPSPLPYKLTIHAGANLNLGADHFTLSPNILLMQQQDFQMFLPGITAKYAIFVLGVSYRNKDAFIINAGFQVHYFTIGYSYDYTTSTLTNATTGGAHELHLIFYPRISKKGKPLSMRMI